jgi:hypothetical protein
MSTRIMSLADIPPDNPSGDALQTGDVPELEKLSGALQI